MPDGQEAPITFKEYVDSAVAEVRRAVEIAKDVPPPESVPLRQYIEAIFDEQRRGMVVAEQEREKTRGVAEQEREKAARALRIELEREITTGDMNLRDHIRQQVEQIQAALDSAEKLEVQRIESLRRETRLIQDAASSAVSKAEAANQKQFEAVNEFRQTLSDQTGSFLPREVAEAQFAELRRAITDLADKVSRLI